MAKKNKYSREISQERRYELKKMALEILRAGSGSVMSEETMVEKLELKGKEIGTFAECLDELVTEGLVTKNRRGRYTLPENVHMLPGIMQVTKKGFGFLIPDDGSQDIFVSRNDMADAINGDHVLVKLQTEAENGAKRSGYVARILKRNTTEVTGTFISSRNYAFVVTDNRRLDDVFIAKSDWNGAVTGDKVLAVITKYPADGVGLRGRITEIYGRSGESEAELRAVLNQYGIEEYFDETVLSEADALNQKITDADTAKREDLRNHTVITIDGSDAKDLDDAVSVEINENGNYILGVHIADVSHYVKEGSALDREALRRGCSFYLLDKVIPMLPEQLSNGICSLSQNVDRLTLSVEMEINNSGEVINHRIFESVINSNARMVYDDVSDIIENQDERLIEKYRSIYPMICNMAQLASVLRAKREKGGSLDFDIEESYIELDEDGVPVDIRPSERRTANRLIEEFMLTANKTIAEHYFWMDVPFVYRVHEKPDQQKMEDFKAFAGTLGYSLKGSLEKIHPKALQEILQQAADSDAEGIVNRVMLRSMKKAEYQPICNGHFGLGFTYYCHFTSPIRRYPDLMIHRIIKEIISSGLTKERQEILSRQTEEACVISSKQERTAIDAERTVEKKKKVQYMMEHVGESYEGIISGVVNSGFFVELANTVEGFVPAESLKDDYYVLDSKNYRLTGEHTGKTFSVGQRVKIEVDNVSPATDEIDFRLA